VRVTAISTDTLTVTRAQESTSASTKNTASKTYKMIAGLTAKTFDIDLASFAPLVINGRLTLESGSPITRDVGEFRAAMNPLFARDAVNPLPSGTPRADMIAKTTIYFTPYQGNSISIYDGSHWMLHTFSELSLPLGTLVADTNYDVFIYSNAGSATLEMGAAWTTATARAGTLVLQDGIWVKGGATTRRYLGTFRTTSTTTTEDSMVKRFIWNASNRVRREMLFIDAVQHVYDGGNRQWHGSATSQVAFVTGLEEDPISVSLFGSTSIVPATPASYNVVGIGLDSTSAFYRQIQTYAAGQIGQFGIAGSVAPQIGYHVLNLLQSTVAQGAVTWEVGSLQALLFT
jgi:hypothetical protein